MLLAEAMAVGLEILAIVSARITIRAGSDQFSAERQLTLVVVSIPEIPYVVLHTYLDKPRQPNDEVVIHAICAELWLGNAPKAMTRPEHTFGFPPRLVKEYAKQLLEALYLKYGNGRRTGFERFAREEQHSIAQCPVRPCSYHAAHLHPYIYSGNS